MFRTLMKILFFDCACLGGKAFNSNYVRLSLFVESDSHSVVSFSHNKSAKNTFSHDFLRSEQARAWDQGCSCMGPRLNLIATNGREGLGHR